MRSGTENLIGISAFGASVADLAAKREENQAAINELRRYAEERLATLPVRINRPAVAIPHIINITLPDIKSETMLHHLSASDVYVSSGSACSSHSHHPSATLLAFGLTPHDADCSLRISMSAYNTAEDIDALTAALADGIEHLVKIRH